MRISLHISDCTHLYVHCVTHWATATSNRDTNAVVGFKHLYIGVRECGDTKYDQINIVVSLDFAPIFRLHPQLRWVK